MRVRKTPIRVWQTRSADSGTRFRVFETPNRVSWTPREAGASAGARLGESKPNPIRELGALSDGSSIHAQRLPAMRRAIHQLRVGPELFARATEAIRAHSLATGMFSSLNSVARAGAEWATDGCWTPDILTEGLALAADPGTLKVVFMISEDWDATYREAIGAFEAELARRLAVRQILSLLISVALFHLGEQNARDLRCPDSGQ